MSSYYPSFNYMGLNSLKDKHLIVTAFDADSGESDTFLGMDCVYTDMAYGTRRLDYGAKYNSVAVIKITVMNANGKDFTVADVRDFLRWTTGVRHNSYMDMLIGDTIKFSFLGRVTSAYQQKLDARTIGMSIEFTSVSPWAYSPVQTLTYAIGDNLCVIDDGILVKNESTPLPIEDNGVLYNYVGDLPSGFNTSNLGTMYLSNTIEQTVSIPSDDLYSYIYPDVVITNKFAENVITIANSSASALSTALTHLSNNEVITLSAQQFITSSIDVKSFGDRFNFYWPQFVAGDNNITISAIGQAVVEFNYRYPIKIGDCAIDVYTNDNACDYCDNNTYGYVEWSDVVNTPTTVKGYGITDAYTTEDINNIVGNINETELDNMLDETFGN